MPDTGFVVLVGAGPGDSGLLTLAGKAALERADVVLHDRLIGDGLLAMIPPSAERIDVGKNKGDHPVPQSGINDLVVRLALEGKYVVRLKGGDPFLFGRGGEELEAVAERGIPFRVVPGVSSAIAAPACAGIPITHRDYSSSLHILTGHGKNGAPPDIPYREMARAGGTLVFLMALSNAGEICRNLVEAGLPADTPAAMVENGARANQRRLSGTVATLPALAVEAAFSSPSVLVVGRVVELADRLDWTVGRPLSGRRVLAVSSARTGGRLAALLRDEGCSVDEFAGVAIERIRRPDAFWKGVGGYDWIVLTSRHGVECFFEEMLEAGVDVRALARARFAVVGEQTGRALRQKGVIPDFVPTFPTGQALGRELAWAVGADEKILLFRAEAGGADLPEELKKRAAVCDDVPAYRTNIRTPEPAVLERIRTGAYDAVTFTSASAVEAFMEAVPPGGRLPTAFCIGGTTAGAAEKNGFDAITSRETTLESMIRIITERLGKKPCP